ncbi:MAG TPA: LamG-like jellyroll fold domain-containing protein, partial [Blastocatellia bacterium]|nr:LamG-like jellyroll fold domain-containing protein [Blastocatellia bacterium]
MEGQSIRLNRRRTRLIYVSMGLLLALGLLWNPKTVTVQSGPQPQVTLTVPAEALIGEDFTFTVKFKNATSNPGDIGYAPFIDLVLDAGGANITKPAQTPPCACDGITFVKAEMVGVVGGPVSLNSFPVPAPCNPMPPTVALPHPFAASGITPVTVPAGAQLITLELPFGSFDPTQPEIEVQVTAHVSNLADAGAPLKIFARGGFRYGADPLDNPSTDPPILSDTTPSTQWTVNAQTTPTVLTTKKEYLGPEDETATGPNFTSYYPLQYKITVDIANGQTVNNVTVTDCFPNNLAFQSVVSVSPSTPPPTVTPPPAGVPNNPPNNCLTVTWVSLTGGPGPDAMVVVEFFIPEKDANGNPVLPPNCQPVQSVNDVKAEGDWTPIDPCDTSPAHVISDVKPDDHILNDKCIAIQKKVAVFQDTGAPGPTPGDVLQYTLTFQISDFKTFGKLEVRDLLSDGQQFLPTPAPTLTVTDQFGAVSGSFIPLLDLSVTPDPNSTCQGIKGGTSLLFRVSQKMTNLFPLNPRHLAGILTGGWATTPTSTVLATGQIVFYAQIQDQFSFPQNHPGDPFVDKDDPLANCVEIRGEVFTNVNPPQLPTPTGVTAQDDSKTLTAIVTDLIKKTVYAVKRAGQEICGPNTSPCPAKPQVTPGDEVTFRIEKVIPSSDAENLTIQDWLPLPIFDVADPDADGTAGPAWTFTAAACGIPTPGLACLGPTNSLTVSLLFAAAPTTNSLTFNYGTFNSSTNTPRKIDLLFTVTATNDPFADGLFLTNEAQECEDNTFKARFCQVAIAQVQMAEPNLRIIKGVVASDNPNAIFSPAAPPSGTFTPPGGSCPRFSGTINSSNIGSLNLNSNISGVDANDKVTFAIVVENQGSSPNGVFDVKIRDIIPLGPTDLPSCFVPDFNTLCVTDGTGTPIPFTVSPGGFGSVIIELTDPGPTTGALGPFNPTNGKNIAVITFDAMLLSDIKSGCCDNRARLENYSNTEGGPNFVTAGFGGPFEDTARACVGPTPFAKCIQTTSEVHTIPQSASQGGTVDAAIGEIVRYRLITVIPEGTTPNFQIQDLLPPGLTYLPGTARVLFVADSSVTSGSAFWPTVPGPNPPQCPGSPTPTSNLLEGGGPFTPGAGVDPIFFVGPQALPITNNDNDPNLEFAIIEFNALVDNIASNQSSTTLPNQFQVRFTDEAGNPFASNSGAVNVHVVEPNLKLTKSVSPAAVVLGGPPVTYTVTIANTGTADAFDSVFTDTLPPGLTVVTGSLTLPAGCTGSAAGQNVSVTCPQLDDGAAIQITYQATVSATAPCPTTLTNQATITWTSLPGPNGSTTNPTGSSTPGASGSINGERNGSSTFPPNPPNSPDPPNKYHATASAALTVNCPQCTSVSNEQVSCNPNGTFSYTATVTNLSNTVATGINLVPPPGVTITPSSITTPLPPGQSLTGTVTISGPNAQPGATICFDIVLTGQGQVICQTKHCITLPTCPGGPCVPAPSGMVGWWPLDDAVGQSTVQDLAGGNNGTTKDPSGNPLNISLGAGPQVVSQLPAPNILGGTLNPVVVDPTAPPPPPTPRGALFFNRSFAEAPHNSSLNIGPSGITITLWVWAAPTPVAITPLIEKFASGNGYSLYLEVSGSTYVVKFNLNGTIITGPPVPFGTTPSDWRFIAARVSASGSVTLTVCDLSGSCTTSAPITVTGFTTSNTAPLWFARSAVAFPGAVFTALELALDEVEIFNRALTPAELQTIYDAERQGRRKCP